MPVTGDDVVIEGAAAQSQTTYDLGAGVQLRSITINSANNDLLTIFGGPIVLQSGGFITDNLGDGSFNQTFPSITLNGSTTFTLASGNGNLVFGGSVTGTAPLTLVNNSSNDRLRLSVANTYTGATIVNGTGRVRFDVNGAVPTGSALFQASSTIGSLAGGGNVFMNGNNTLTVGGDNTSTTFSGVYQDSGGAAVLAKTGTGTLTLSGANTYTGGTTVTAGTLSVSADNNLGAAAGGLTLNGGTLQYGAGFSSARGVTLNAGGGTFDTNGNSSTLSGVLSGTGALTKSGTGTLTLSGANTYTGGTTVSAGTLAGTTASLQGAITNNAAVTFEQSTTGTYAGVISGTGSLTKTGTGDLKLTGTNTYTGGTTVSAGILSVNGSLASALTVGSSGTLGGSGTITGLVTANGKLAPGNSIGTLTVTGDLTFGAGAVYEVEVNAAGQSDKTEVSGTATLTGATVSALPETGTYARRTQYTILTAGSLVGTFDSVTSSSAFLDPSLSYTATSVLLNLLRNDVTYAATAQTGNQRAVAEALDRAYASASGDFLTVTDELDTLSASQAQSAFTNMTGQLYGTLATIGVTTGTVFNRTLTGRIGQRQAGKGQRQAGTGLAFSGLQLAAADTGVLADTGLFNGSGGGGAGALSGSGAGGGSDPADPQDQGWWLRGYGVSGGLNGDGNATGAIYHLGGAGLGYDHVFRDKLLLGIGGAYIETNAGLDGRVDTARVKSWQGAAYGSYAEGPLSVQGIARYGVSQVKTTRAVTVGTLNRTATGDANGQDASLYAEAAYAVPTPWLTIQPVAALQWIRLYQGTVNEQGADSLNLQVDARTSNYLRSLLGSRLLRTFALGTGELVTEARALWSHELGDTAAAITGRFAGAPAGGTFTVQGVPLAKNGAVLGAGAMATLAEGLNGYFDYNAELRSNQTEHQLIAGFRWSW